MLFFGLPLGALALERAGLRVVGAGVRGRAPGLSRLRRRLDAVGAPLLERPSLDDDAVLDRLAATRPDQIAVWFWPRLLPPAVLRLAPFAFNVHPSLLPRHRGPDPYFWALAERDEVVGVSAHRLGPSFDSGPIIGHLAFPMPARGNAWALARWLDRPGLRLLCGVARAHAAGVELSARRQLEARVTEAPHPLPEQCELRWRRPTAELLALVRAAAPEPGAYTEVGDGVLLVVLAASPAERPGSFLSPGRGVRTGRGILVGTGDGAMRVDVARVERRDGDEARRGPTARGAAVAELAPRLPFLGRPATKIQGCPR